MKQEAQFAPQQRSQTEKWRHIGLDTLLALAGVALATAIITLTHLYPLIPTISLAYLLVVLALASTRGLYAAILASFLAFFCYLYFLVPPLYTFIIPRVVDFFTLVIFLATAITTGQLASALRKRAEQAQNRERELRMLYKQAQELAALQERQHLARELHDSVSQALYGISLGAITSREALESGESEEALTSLEYVISLAEAGMAEMRTLIFELRPEILASEGLVAALVKHVTVLQTRYQLTVEEKLGEEPQFSLEKKYALYRIAQESLHNIVKHAHASVVVLSLTTLETEVILEVRDNGKGFDPDASFPGHFGLQSMRERAAKVGGTLIVESSPGQGALLRAEVPRSDS
jgi:signal transduction histidine kinase